MPIRRTSVKRTTIGKGVGGVRAKVRKLVGARKLSSASKPSAARKLAKLAVVRKIASSRKRPALASGRTRIRSVRRTRIAA